MRGIKTYYFVALTTITSNYNTSVTNIIYSEDLSTLKKRQKFISLTTIFNVYNFSLKSLLKLLSHVVSLCTKCLLLVLELSKCAHVIFLFNEYSTCIYTQIFVPRNEKAVNRIHETCEF